MSPSLWQRVLAFPKSILLAVVGVGVVFYYLNTHALQVPERDPLRPLAEQPYEASLSAVGLIEANNEAVRVMPYFSGRIAKVFVQEGDTVKVGDPLYQVDTQQLQANIARQGATIAALQATVNRLQHQPRPETLPPLRANVAQAQALYQKEKALYDRLLSVSDPRAVSQNEVTTQGLATQAALAAVEQAKAALKQAEAGAWRYEVQEAQAQVASAQAALKELQVQLAQATVRSPVAGTVLQVNTRVGEFVAAMPPGNSLGAGEDSAVLVGALTPLQVRVDVDEVTATYLKLGAPAVGVLKGNADLSFPLRYVRLQPLMVPKRSLTGSTAERVDVRVLQLIYEMDQPKDFPVYVGQQVEVFLQDTRSTKPATAPSKRTGGV